MFADVILPVPIPQLYTYKIPGEFEKIIAAGQRVIAEFGASKLLTGVVRRIHNTPPSLSRVKPVENILDARPVISEKMFRFWDWIASYYLCSPGEVMSAALPSGLRLSGETVITWIPGIDPSAGEITGKEVKILEALEKRKKLTLHEVSKIIERKAVYPLIKSMVEKNLVSLDREVRKKYTPKTETFIRLAPEFSDEKKLEDAFTRLANKPRQLRVLMTYINLSQRYSREPAEVKKGRLQKASGCTMSVISRLIRKGILNDYDAETSYLPTGQAGLQTGGKTVRALKELTPEQAGAYSDIEKQLSAKDVVLFHGVTSSGKTEIYIHFIEKYLSRGFQVLYLLPEIALTAQIISRLRNVFGDMVGVYHSRFNENERTETWLNILNFPSAAPAPAPQRSLILGPRSAVFLPYSNLGLVIIDEEHDANFKQDNPAPRYHGRDAAIYLAKLHGAKVILGSATPSLESYFNGEEGKYGRVDLSVRYGDHPLPDIEIINLKDEYRKKSMKSHFSPRLLEVTDEALKNHDQVIIFQNRRGFAPVMVCTSCAWMPHCDHCDVTLVYHKRTSQLRCHYCGFARNIVPKCPACGDTKLQVRGFGTEKIEEELKPFFPDARIARMDLDTTRSKDAYTRIISEFENGEIDILVGTQMITKGLDFDRVSVVGILHADNLLGFPDFRAFERGYQLMAQVSGRAGRKKRGKVILQTFHPDHPVISDVLENRYDRMVQRELEQRRKFLYPPYCRLVKIELRHRNFRVLQEGAGSFAASLKSTMKSPVYGPVTPVIGRIADQYIMELLIKMNDPAAIRKEKEAISAIIPGFHSKDEFRSIRVICDVDPMNL